MNSHDLERLLQHGAFVRTLARDLVAGAADVDDLVQETWLRALAKPAKTSFSPRAWLAGLVRNVARERRRSEVRRGAREKLQREVAGARDARDEDPAALAERFDLVRRVLTFVDELAEPQRTTLLSRYLDGLDPLEIARRQGVPDATVRSRIKRGLEELRGRLDQESNGDRARWMGALLPWAQDAVDAAAATAATAATGAGGAMVVKTSSMAAIAVAAVLIVAGAVAVKSWSTPDEPLASAAPTRIETAAVESLPTPAPDLAVSASAPDRRQESGVGVANESVESKLEPASESVASTEWRVEGRLHGLDGSIPWTGSIRVSAAASDDSNDVEFPVFDAELDSDGTFGVTLSGLASRAANDATEPKRHLRWLKVAASDPHYVDVDGSIDVHDERGVPHAAPKTFRLEMKTHASAWAHGRVVDEHNRPLVGVVVSWRDWNPHESERSTTTDSGGRWRLETAGSNRAIIGAHVRDPHNDANAADLRGAFEEFIAAELEVELQTGADVLVPDLVLKRGIEIRGEVVDGQGAPVQGAVVRGRLIPDSSHEGLPDSDLIREKDAVSAADGTFRLAGLVPGSWNLRVLEIREAATHCVVSNDRDFGAIQAEAPSDGVIVVNRLCRVELRAQLDGQPVASLPLNISATSRDGKNNCDHGGRTDADGCFTFFALPGCKYQTWVYSKDIEPVTPEFKLDDDAVDRVVVLDLEHRRPRATLSVKLCGSNRETVRRAWFRFTSKSGEEKFPREFRLELGGASTNTDDAFLMTDLEPDDYHVLVRPGGGHYGTGGFYQESEFDITLEEGSREALEIKIRPTGRLQVFAVDPQSNGVRADCEIRTPDGMRIPANFARETTYGASFSPKTTFDEQPAFVTPPPAPGDYLLTFTAEGFVPQTIEAEVTRGETTEIQVTLQRR